MKKRVKSLAFIVSLLVFLTMMTFSVDARSGCCSYHGGVNCSAGADADGSVICKDGWKDSSCSYASMGCKTSSTTTITTNTDKPSNNNVPPSSTGNGSLIEGLIALSAPVALLCLASDYGSHETKKNIQPKTTERKSFGAQDVILCPKCGGKMVKRHGRYGYFYGCSNYPYCKGTRRIDYDQKKNN